MKVGHQNARNQKQSANHVQYKVIDSGPFVPSRKLHKHQGQQQSERHLQGY